jgi:DNA-binding response OmpR family regulator
MKRVLVIEDDADIGRVLDLVLFMAGYLPQTASTIEAARACLALRPYDLVLADAILPDGDGLDLCRELVTGSPPTPVIVVSGDVGRGIRERALAAGAAHFVAKPFDPEALERVVRMTLGDAPDRRRAPRSTASRAA